LSKPEARICGHNGLELTRVVEAEFKMGGVPDEVIVGGEDGKAAQLGCSTHKKVDC
jgi:hypothetical protein